MIDIEQCLAMLSERHCRALRWFIDHAGQERPWPGQLSDGTLLASKAKGIYKPSWTKYALSVRRSLGGPYPDREPKFRPDGTWSFEYFQENTDPDQRDAEYTNVGMVRCMDDGVPVGVFTQVSTTPSARYRILGLASVGGWEAGYFQLEGFSTDGMAYRRRSQADVNALLKQHESTVFRDWDDFGDGRDFAIATVVRRRGQPKFRRALLEAYRGRCAISGCDAEVALEACHIRPYRGSPSNTFSNGLLLRADLHTLFDLGLIAVDTKNMKVVIAPELEGTSYGEFAGLSVASPAIESSGSNLRALDWHFGWTGMPSRNNQK